MDPSFSFLFLILITILVLGWIVYKHDDKVRLGKIQELIGNPENIDLDVKRMLDLAKSPIGKCPKCGTPNVQQGKFCLNCGSPLLPYIEKELSIGSSSSKGALPYHMNQWLADNPYIEITNCQFISMPSFNIITRSQKLSSVRIRGYITPEKHCQYAVLDLKKHNGYFVPKAEDLVKEWEYNNPSWHVVTWNATINSRGPAGSTRTGMSHTANVFALARKNYEKNSASNVDTYATHTQPLVEKPISQKRKKGKPLLIFLCSFVLLCFLGILGIYLYSSTQPAFYGHAEYNGLTVSVNQRFPKLIKVNYTNRGNSPYSFSAENLHAIIHANGQNYPVSAIGGGNKTIKIAEKGAFYFPALSVEGTIESIEFNIICSANETGSPDISELLNYNEAGYIIGFKQENSNNPQTSTITIPITYD